MKNLNVDVAIIGAGTAGLTAYRAVKAAGLSAVMIEGGPYGTTCARVGCMPSKLLIAAAEAAHSAANTAPFGVHIDSPVRVNGVEVMDRVKRERDRFVGFVLDSVDSIAVSDKIRGYARFLSDTVLQVDEHTRIEAPRVVIATGSTPVVPARYEALGDRLIVNDDVFYWDDLPRRVMVLGPGVIGLELGQALARLGVQLRLLGRSASLGGLSDPDVKASALAAFQAEFSLSLNTRIISATREGNEVEVRWVDADGREALERFDYLLMAAGRRPNLDHLHLENTSLALDEKGLPHFDRKTLQLGTLPIFFAGDADGELLFLHEAADEGRIAGENAARYPNVQPGQRRAPLSIVFTDPQIAQVGVHFKDLPTSGVVFGEIDFAGQGRSRVMLKNRGKLRVYADQYDGRFLGAEMAGPSIEHIAHLLSWAVQQELTVPTMLEMPFYHPVVEEGLRTALRQAANQLTPVQEPLQQVKSA
ncbi:MAG: dihydrolipoyl dehydrogenase [Candidimonas sp.]|nr:MAG: dihydrolipoyl dehydrogenase [Candidimonas sp.]TAM20266.1 MAG: dihydrolipoyl dehydrogenase [Candidimonas sp.]TAM79985.1 MAG: dihydrolipoyl dehydrogenase [Candidimonas sp.]